MFKILTTLLALALLLAGCGERSENPSHVNTRDGLRIISLAPNVTEILYALGLSNQVIGVSRYSNYPPATKEKPQVGGTYDPNWEMIVSLQPDLVIGLDSQKEIASQLEQLGIHFLGVPHERVKEIMNSVLIIGEACDTTEKAQALFQSLEKNMRRKVAASGSHKPRVLVCIGHDEQLTRMYIAAKNTFYDDLITLAGGINACEQSTVKYPEISPEGLRAMQPDLIIDILPNPGSFSPNVWKHPNVITITNSYAFIPGPRFGFLLNDIAQAIQQGNEQE